MGAMKKYLGRRVVRRGQNIRGILVSLNEADYMSVVRYWDKENEIYVNTNVMIYELCLDYQNDLEDSNYEDRELWEIYREEATSMALDTLDRRWFDELCGIGDIMEHFKN